jgi:hypothetical protein
LGAAIKASRAEAAEVIVLSSEGSVSSVSILKVQCICFLFRFLILFSVVTQQLLFVEYGQVTQP